jgi:hypothetical protein
VSGDPVLSSPLDTAALLAAIGALFAALMVEMRGRREREEKRGDALLDDNRKLAGTVADLTTAVRELHALCGHDRAPR